MKGSNLVLVESVGNGLNHKVLEGISSSGGFVFKEGTLLCVWNVVTNVVNVGK